MKIKYETNITDNICDFCNEEIMEGETFYHARTLNKNGTETPAKCESKEVN